MNTLARIISYVFHPLFLATYFFALLSWAVPSALDPVPAEMHSKLITVVLIITFCLPALLLGILKAFGVVRTYHLEERDERIVPFVMVSVLYVGITYLFYYRHGMSFNDSFLKLFLVIDLLVVVATVVTFFFKVSIHSLTIWGILGMMVPLNKLTEVPKLFFPTVISIVLAGVIMSARLQLNAHTLREVMWGGVLGLATAMAGMFILFGS